MISFSNTIFGSILAIRGASKVIALMIVGTFLLLNTNVASAQNVKYPNIPYIVVDADSGVILKENRSFERWHPASLTKLMTAYVTFKAIQNDELSIGSPVTISKAARRMPPSKMGYKLNAKLRVDTAITILIVKSANDVAFALAESVAGSEPAFVRRMNAEAKRLGMRDSNFANPHGLHKKSQYVSARDMLILSKAIWNEFPQYRYLFGTPSIKAGKKTYHAYNLLLERYPGTKGMKTGFVCASGYNMVASAEREGRNLVAVVFGAYSQTQRAVTAAKLFDHGFKNNQGTLLTNSVRPKTIKGPTNLRPTICSKKAWETRYDPAADKAVINSPFLQKRKITKKPIKISLGGIDAPASDAWLARAFTPSKVPVPTKRPDYAIVSVDGEALSGAMLLNKSIPIPTPSPRVQ